MRWIHCKVFIASPSALCCELATVRISWIYPMKNSTITPITRSRKIENGMGLRFVIRIFFHPHSCVRWVWDENLIIGSFIYLAPYSFVRAVFRKVITIVMYMWSYFIDTLQCWIICLRVSPIENPSIWWVHHRVHIEAQDIPRLLLTFCTNIHEAAVQSVTKSIFRIVHQRQNAGTCNGQKANYFISFATTKSKSWFNIIT